MIGQSMTELATFPCNLYHRLWGYASIHTRQKWSLLWPYLNQLPDTLQLIDAGCGTGDWTLEIATRKPNWTVLGLDINQESIDIARKHQKILGLTNVSFTQSDFLDYQPEKPFDVVLSVMSAHYLAQDNAGEALFRQFHGWMHNNSKLILLGPRHVDEAPFVSWLQHPKWHNVFTHSDFKQVCEVTQLNIEQLIPCVGLSGTMAKQVDWTSEHSISLLRVFFYLPSWLLSVADRHRQYKLSDATLMWLLIAQRIQDDA